MGKLWVYPSVHGEFNMVLLWRIENVGRTINLTEGLHSLITRFKHETYFRGTMQLKRNILFDPENNLEMTKIINFTALTSGTELVTPQGKGRFTDYKKGNFRNQNVRIEYHNGKRIWYSEEVIKAMN